jgi:hypothetical protein
MLAFSSCEPFQVLIWIGEKNLGRRDNTLHSWRHICIVGFLPALEFPKWGLLLLVGRGFIKLVLIFARTWVDFEWGYCCYFPQNERRVFQPVDNCGWIFSMRFRLNGSRILLVIDFLVVCTDSKTTAGRYRPTNTLKLSACFRYNELLHNTDGKLHSWKSLKQAPDEESFSKLAQFGRGSSILGPDNRWREMSWGILLFLFSLIFCLCVMSIQIGIINWGESLVAMKGPASIIKNSR